MAVHAVWCLEKFSQMGGWTANQLSWRLPCRQRICMLRKKWRLQICLNAVGLPVLSFLETFFSKGSHVFAETELMLFAQWQDIMQWAWNQPVDTFLCAVLQYCTARRDILFAQRSRCFLILVDGKGAEPAVLQTRLGCFTIRVDAQPSFVSWPTIRIPVMCWFWCVRDTAMAQKSQTPNWYT